MPNYFDQFDEASTPANSNPAPVAAKPNAFDQFDPAPRVAKRPTGFIDAAVRGFKRSLPETKMLAGAALAAGGGLVGADSVRDYGLGVYNRGKASTEPLQGPSFQDVREGKAGVGEYVGDVVGNFGGQGLQSAVSAGAGALIGGAAGSEVPIAGNAVGAVVGAVGGVVARGAVKKAVEHEAEKLIIEQMAKGATREAAEAAAAAATKKTVQKIGGAALGGVAHNTALEIGTSYGGRADDAAAAGQQLDSGDAARAIAYGVPAGLADTAAEALQIGRVFHGMSASPRLAKRVLAGATQGAAIEGLTEGSQAVLERAGSNQSLTDSAALNDYLENTVAGATGGAVLGAPGGIRRVAARPTVRPAGSITQSTSETPIAVAEPAVAPHPNAAPGSISDAANVIAQRPVARRPDDAGFRRQLDEAGTPVSPTPVSDQAASAKPKFQLPPPPWVNHESGEFLGEPDPTTVKAYIHENLNRMEEAGAPALTRSQWKNELGLGSALASNTALGEVKAERDRGLRAPQEATNAPDAAGSAQAALGPGQPGDAATTAPGIESAPAAGAATTEPVTRGSDQAVSETDAGAAHPLSYDDTPEIQEGDITPPSGNAFENRNAAEIQAARHDGGKVFPVDGGYVVRVPTSAQAVQQPQAHGESAPTAASQTQYQPKASAPMPSAPLATEGQTSSQGVGQPSVTPSEAAGEVASQPEHPAPAQATAKSNSAQAALGEPTTRPPEGQPESESRPLAESATAAAPDQVAPAAAEVHAAAHEAATSPLNERPEPTEAQKDAGNYKKGHVKIAGLDISIENPAGSKRRPEWPKLAHHYGYIKGTIGKDKDHVDVFLTEHAADTSRPVFVVDQRSKDGRFDEHKVILGVTNRADAKKAYQANYSKGWRGAGNITQMTHAEFEQWVRDPSQTVQPASKSAVAASQPVAQPQAPGTSRPTTAPASQTAVAAEVSSRPEGITPAETIASIDASKAPKNATEGSKTATTRVKDATPGPITDLGEKIGGARKDLSGGRKVKVDEAPRYVVSESRAPGQWIVRDGKTGKQITEAGRNGRFDSQGAAQSHADQLNSARGEAKASEDTWRKRYAVVANDGMLVGPGRKAWKVVDLRTGRAMRGVEADTKEEAEGMIPLAAVALNNRVIQTNDGKFEIWRDITDRKRVKVVDQQFDSRDEAMRYMAQNAAAIIETKTRFGEEVLAKPDTVNRQGPERRTGDVKGDDFIHTFGFRGVEFGNWNNQAERQEVMNHAFDGLHDLAEVLGIPAKAVSLNGDLALAFGARGQGLTGARAHYEPGKGVINLTKMSGAGALAHEWFHALDHYFGRVDGKALGATRAADGTLTFKAKSTSEAMLSHGNLHNSKMRAELLQSYRDLIQSMFTKAEHYVEDTQQAAKFVGRTQEALAKQLQDIRDGIARDRQYGAKKKAATSEQLAEFDQLATTLLGSPQVFDLRYSKLGSPKASARGAQTMRMTNDTLEAMNTILKAVTGRGGFNAERAGTLDRVRGYARNHAERLAMLESAEKQDTKTKRVPTSFAMEAKKIDQGAVSDYWTTPHEMAARAFSAYVEDKIQEQKNSSDFLSFGSDNNRIEYRMLGIRPFPEGAEREVLDKAFDAFFKEMKTSEADGGKVALYSKAGRVGSDRAAWGSFPATVIAQPFGGNQVRMGLHADYAAAKAGDVDAATRVVHDVLTPEAVARVRALIGDRRPVIVPVSAEEATGHNMLPRAYARALASALGLDVDTDIVQSARAFHTGASAYHRLSSRRPSMGRSRLARTIWWSTTHSPWAVRWPTCAGTSKPMAVTSSGPAC
jgi:hypothetical protein